ncbi:MAG: deoxyhypusine synthase [Candidatus Thermoplasmatota archaeon]
MKKQPVEDIKISEELSVDQFIRQLKSSGGFTAKKVGKAVDIVEEMVNQDDCINFLSFPACIVSTGTRGVIKELLKRDLFDIVMTTCGTLDHDLARLWKDYYHGHFMVDDNQLHQKGVNRLGNIFIPNECYGKVLEEKMQPILKEVCRDKKKWSTKELIWKFGEQIKDEEKAEESIIYWVWKNKIPFFVPGITDGAFGSQIWMYYQQNHDFFFDLLKDEQDISDMVFDAKKTGALIVGGGISKHHTIWWNQFKDGLDYTVYITTAQEFDGSLSGAKTREAISWGKIREKSDNVTVNGDATVLLPLIVAGLFERVKKV